MFFCVIFNFSNFLSPTLKKLRSEHFAFALFVCSFIRYSIHNTLPYVQKMDIGLAKREGVSGKYFPYFSTKTCCGYSAKRF